MQDPTFFNDNVSILAKEIRIASLADIKAGNLDVKVEQAIHFATHSELQAVATYQCLAYAMFSGRGDNFNIHLYLLRLMLVALHNQVPIKSETFALLLQNAWNTMKEKCVIQGATKAEPQSCLLGKYVDGDQDPTNPDALCSVNHGGGWRHINDFLSGNSQGYPLDFLGDKFPGFGIYVTPANSGYSARAFAYALRAATRNCDTPAMFTAKIAQKYLVKTPNAAYEIGVPAEHFDKFLYVQIKQFKFSQYPDSYAETDFLRRDVVSEYYEKNSCVYQDFIKVQREMDPELTLDPLESEELDSIASRIITSSLVLFIILAMRMRFKYASRLINQLPTAKESLAPGLLILSHY